MGMVIKQKAANFGIQARNFVPTRVMEIELGQPLLPLISAVDEQQAQLYQRALCLVRLHAQPLGTVTVALPPAGLPVQAYLPVLWDALREEINAHLLQDGLPAVRELTAHGLTNSEVPRCQAERAQFLANAPCVSVIVSTHDRPACFATCLRSLLALRYPRYEIIVVDNAPSSSATADLVQQCDAHEPAVRYICEPRQGLALARNCGIQAARGAILVFTDDDVVVDPYWLVELVRPFSLSERVACVSGLIVPLRLDTEAQFWFEAYGGFSRGFSRRCYDMAEHRQSSPVYPYCAGSFGTGASMAFSASFLQRMGGFDPALGAGRPTQGGEDIAMFFQVIKQGYTLVYEPRALLYHLHRQEYAALLKQLRGNGVGLTAYLTKNIVDHPQLLCEFLAKVPVGLFLLLRNRYAGTTATTQAMASYPRALALAELSAMLSGPFAYLRSCWQMRGERHAIPHQEIVRDLAVTSGDVVQ